MSDDWKAAVEYLGFLPEELLAGFKQRSIAQCRVLRHPLEGKAVQGWWFSRACQLSFQRDPNNQIDYFLGTQNGSCRPTMLVAAVCSDPASVLPVAALNTSPADKVLDLCAAPGGKSLLLASRLLVPDDPAAPVRVPPGVRLVANDASDMRVKRLSTNLRAHFGWARGVIQVVKSNPLRSSAAVGKQQHSILSHSFTIAKYGPYDAVLVDAPCSSDRHKFEAGDLISWTTQGSKAMATEQFKLLVVASRLVKPEGRLVYSTCSLSQHENDGVIARFLETSNFHCIEPRLDSVLAGATQQGLACQLTPTQHGCLVLPHLNGGCGPIFFAALQAPSPQ